MRFNVILHGEIDTVNNFDQRASKLAELIDIDINFLGPLLGAKESVVMSNLEFTEARAYMAKIIDLGFKAEVRPTIKSESGSDKKTVKLDNSALNQTHDNLILNQKRASFKAPTDMPEEVRKPLKERMQPSGSSLGKLKEVDDVEELSLADDEATDGNFNKYNWSKDLEDDDVVKYNDDLVIKKGR